jgi:hypothetical protein
MLIVCALLAAGSSVSEAQEGQKPPGEVLVQLTVQPMGAPRPALKYQLLPELKEMNPGNPIQGYLKCFMEQQNFFFNQTSAENREKWAEIPLKELPRSELRGYGGYALRRADEAARLDTPDWQVLLDLKRDGVNLLLPEVQQLRTLATALRVRMRGEIADGRFDDAITTAKTMFALARHFETHPSLIADLVGLAIAGLGMGTLEEMIQQPGCPNLYWALTDLPRPFIDLRKGLQGERLMVAAEFPGLIDTAPMSEPQLQRILARWGEGMKHMTETKKKEMTGWIEGLAKDEDRVRAARQRLIAGFPQERVKKFPALQAVLLDDKREYEAQLDEEIKWMVLPFWQGEAGYLANVARPNKHETLFGKLLLTLFGEPSWDRFKVRGAQVRVDRRIAMLRTVEALRLYAADHDGKLPGKLGDLTVPVPDDPITGKPFTYKVENSTAELRGGPPKAFATNSAFNLRYVITVKK